MLRCHSIPHLNCLLFALASFFLFPENKSFGKELNGFFINPALLYQSSETKEENETGIQTEQESLTSVNINFAYTLSNSMFLGVKYLNESSDKSNLLFSSSDSENTSNAMGLCAGFNYGGLLLSFSYMGIQAPSLVSATHEYKNGSGYMLEAGYYINMGSWWFGPQLSQRSFSYQDHFENSVKDSSFKTLTIEKMNPYLGFILMI
jgi:hypothetical protein